MATNNKENGEHCDHCCDMHRGYMGYYGFRWVLGIVVLLMMFWLGMKVGEFKGFVEANYGGFGERNMMYKSGPGMMYFQTPLNSIGTTAPTTAPKK